MAKTTISYEYETCSRCGGTGRMPFEAYGGQCLKCHGQGRHLTSAAKRVRDIVTATLSERLRISVAELSDGMLVRIGDVRQPRARVVSVTPREDGRTTVELAYKTSTMSYVLSPEGGSAVFRGLVTDEDMQAAVAALGKRRTGFTVTRDEE
jgi:hypothetical protein